MNGPAEGRLNEIRTIDDIKSGRLPGYFFPKLMELGALIIVPFDEKSLGNICYYLHLGNRFRIPRENTTPIDPASKESIETAFEPYMGLGRYVLGSGQSIIAQTRESLGINKWLLAKLENTTELGRIFLNHASHGFIHPGHGITKPSQLMVELTNLGTSPVVLQPGLQIFRMYIEKLAYQAEEHAEKGNTPRLRMDADDRS